MPLINSTFKPAWWLSNPHLQTLWPTFFRRRPSLALQKERVELADGDFLDISLSAIDEYPDKPLILLLHGLEGSLHSHYAKPLIKSLQDQGFNICFMHFRGCSDEPNRLPRSYHSGETGDLQSVIEYLNTNFQQTVFAVIGVSLGGNVLLKWLGEQAENAATKTAIAISVPFKLEHAAQRLEHSFSRIYQQHLITKCQQKYQQKFARLASPIDVNIESLKTFYQFDNQVTAPLHGFKSADEYYEQSSSRQFLKTIKKPTLIIHARDDPFMWPNTLPNKDEISSSVQLEVSKNGGHVGFIEGNLPFYARYWLDKRIVEWLKEQFSEQSESS